MRAETKELKTRIHKLLLETDRYISATYIAHKVHRAKSAVYRIVRLLREDGIGIYATPYGYVIAEAATQNDDVHFLRMINGRHVSSVISFNAAKPHIMKRWKGIEEQKLLMELSGILNADKQEKLLEDSRKIVETFAQIID